MTPEKAREILDSYQARLAFKNAKDFRDALISGIEALDRHIAREHLTFTELLEPLPSELVKAARLPGL